MSCVWNLFLFNEFFVCDLIVCGFILVVLGILHEMEDVHV